MHIKKHILCCHVQMPIPTVLCKSIIFRGCPSQYHTAVLSVEMLSRKLRYMRLTWDLTLCQRFDLVLWNLHFIVLNKSAKQDLLYFINIQYHFHPVRLYIGVRVVAYIKENIYLTALSITASITTLGLCHCIENGMV